MTARIRAVLASSAAGAVGAALLLTGRSTGTVATALMLVLAVRAGPAAASESSSRELRLLASFVPAWALISAAAGVRAGSAVIADVRGAQAVAGIALARGPAASVIGSWLCVIAASVAVAASLPQADDDRLPVLARMAWLGAGLQAVLAVTFFAGPDVRRATDVVPWLVAFLAVGLAGAGARARVADERAGAAAALIAAAGLALVAFGGAP